MCSNHLAVDAQESSGAAPRRPVLLVSVLCVALFLLGLGAKDFHTRGEAREALVARSVLSGQWVLPEGYGGGVPSKPPLLHWAVGVLGQVVPTRDEFLFRLPSALAAGVFLVGMCGLVSRRLTPTIGLWSAVLLLTSVEWWRAALTCRVDMVLSASLAGALLLLYRWHERALRGVPLGAVLLLVAAVLAKGPVGILLPTVIFGVYLLFRGEPVRQLLRAMVIMTVPVLALASFWYVAAYQVGGEAFFAKVYAENIARFTSTMDDNPHDHSVFYLLGTLVLGFLPWSALFLGALCTQREFRAAVWRSVRGLRRMHPLLGFSCISCAIFFLFFSIPASKRSVYLLPMYPFAAVLLAAGIHRVRESVWARWTATTLLGLATGVVLVVALLEIPAVFHHPISISFGHRVAVALQAVFSLAGVSDLFSVLLTAGGLYFAWQRHGVERLAILMCGLLFLAGSSLTALVGNALSPRPFAERVATLVPEGVPLLAVGEQPYAVSFYAKRTVRDADGTLGVGSYVVLPEGELVKLEARTEGFGKPRVLERARTETRPLTEELILVKIEPL